ncbi:hypothetical protein EVAR_81934_1 [Eumeta japonica]|uniref:Uncharacterized protein n=1 Tax=Eumeta variegata TaxID=151549 RepID=A0A4C1ZHP8_EUMVA|nr:hypothetical protein EVAR_81934_1 [Eumeta japonica]
MPGTIQERYPIPIKAYATVSIQEEMPGTSEERQPTLSESYTTVSHKRKWQAQVQKDNLFQANHMPQICRQGKEINSTTEKQNIHWLVSKSAKLIENIESPILKELVLSAFQNQKRKPTGRQVPVLTIPEEFDIVETDFTEIDKQPLVYISGYIASTVVKSLNCVVCEQALKK